MRAETFEIRWHDTQPIYSCSFQPVPPAHLRRVLEHNRAQAAGLEPGKVLTDIDAAGPSKSTPSPATAAPASAPQSKTGIPLSAQGQSWRFATAGGDNHARIWLVHPNIPSPAALAAAAQLNAPLAKHPPRVEYRATLRRHSGVVNCVRFSPKDDVLATTGDDGMLLLWIPSDGPPSTFGSNFDDDGDAEFAKEHWRLRTMSRASSSEVYDMAWSPSGDAIVLGGTDFVARIINANDGTTVREISEHNHYIQGVTWDPLGEYIATQSSDRSVHVHQLLGKAVNELAGVQMASRSSKMDVTHRRNGSNGGQFVWDHMSRPSAKRRASSHASDSEREREREQPIRPGSLTRRAHRSSTPLEVTASAPNGSHSNGGSSVATAVHASQPNTASATAATPSSASSSGGAQPARAATPTLHHSPAPPPHSMNPPQHTPSRRSSFSGSQIGSPPTSATSLAPSHPPSVSAAAGGSTPAKMMPERTGNSSRSASRTRGYTPRSPSPAPPLPAIRAPPSPKQRMAVLQAANSGAMARLGMRLYGDESFSGFFRRLSFSPDGSLLVTPTGIFESTSAPVSSTNTSAATAAAAAAASAPQTPASPTVATLGRDAASPGSPSLPTHPTHPIVGPQRSTVYLYARGNLHRSNAPIAHLPGHKTATLVVKFSPILYELRKSDVKHSSEDDGIAPHPTVPLEVGKQKTVALSSAASAAGGVAHSTAVQERTGNGSSADEASGQRLPSDSPNHSAIKATPASATAISMIGLPYRMVFAVATHDSVWIYDTQQGGPLCCFSNMHYASFTDLTWSPDGQTLMMCSTDGYCSIVVFDYGELGQPYTYQSQPSLQQVPPPTSMAKLSGSPMLRRASAQNVPSSSTCAAGLPASSPSLSGHAAGTAVAEASPALGLGLATSSSGGGLGTTSVADTKGIREIDPPVVPAHTAPLVGMSESTGLIPQSNLSANTSTDTANQVRKKRRIAPTLEGPVGS